jgi:signal recognition particle receptor subunit beta
MQTKHSMDAATHAANAAKEAAAAAAHGAAAAAAGAAQDMVHGATGAIHNAFGSASGAVHGAAGSVHGAATGAAGTVQGAASGAAEHIKNTVKDTIKDYFTSTSSSKTTGSMGSAKSAAGHAASNAADYVKDTMKSTMKESFMDWFWSGSKHKDKHHQHHEKSGFFHFFSLWHLALLFTFFIILLTGLYFMRRKTLPPLVRRMWLRTRTWMMNRRTMIMNMPILNRYGKCQVLICGPVDAGKTVLLHSLAGTKIQPTQTSMEENVVTFKIPAQVLGDKKQALYNTEFEFIDFPGHPSQEFQLNKYIPNIKGVILLVDASSNDSYMRGAKMLYGFFENGQFVKKQIPILICANKTDLSDAQTMTAIRTKILEELNKLRDSPLNVNTIEKEQEGIALIGKAGERLTWENIGTPVSFGQISAKTGNVRDVIDFLEGIQHCCC